MKATITGLCLLGLAGCAASAETPTERATSQYDLYFMGGQSNMDGFGYNAELPDALKGPQDSVMIYAGHPAANGEEGGGLGLWAPLTPGYGTGFWSDGQTIGLNDRFGAELAFAAKLRQQNPDRKIAIIKFSRGGTSLALGASAYGDWSPDYSEGNGRNSYDNALTAISRALSDPDIDDDGVPDRLTPKGILWMQGESDAGSAEIAAAYRDNLTEMMNLLRAALHRDGLPVVLGQIKDSGDTPETRVMAYSPEVIATQNEYAQTDRCAAIVKVTEGFEFRPDDGWHYLSENYLELGEAFATTVTDLEKTCGPQE